MSNYQTINDIASVHLGKAGDGSIVKPYVTPDHIDASLLVGVPRHLNRTAYNIAEDNLPFVGVDVWHGYEVSALTNNGFPVSGMLKWVYPANSPNIVESKSAKLYLNSFNMEKMGSTVAEVINNINERATKDFSEVIGAPVQTEMFMSNTLDPADSINGVYLPLDSTLDVANIEFTAYEESPSILKTVRDIGKVHKMHSSNLRSNCRVTNQPDWGDVYIHIKSGDRLVTNESMLQYIVSMRKENHFHEEVCECIYKRLWDLLEPIELMVACLYTRRGGLDINPVRASSQDLINKFARIAKVDVQTQKTLRQ